MGAITVPASTHSICHCVFFVNIFVMVHVLLHVHAYTYARVCKHMHAHKDTMHIVCMLWVTAYMHGHTSYAHIQTLLDLLELHKQISHRFTLQVLSVSAVFRQSTNPN